MEENERDNLESVSKVLDASIKNNDKISDEFKDLMRACYGRIFHMLGERNFRRWIDMKRLNNQLKELVVESMTKEEEYNEPAVGGYYMRSANFIKLKQKDNKISLKDTGIHENFHLITDHNKYFCTFIDEGLTEYMKSLAYNRPLAYSDNVNFVQFLHNALGDSLIKAYLMGKEQSFDDNLLQMINYDGKSSMQDITSFYSNLNCFHRFNSAKLDYSIIKREENNDEKSQKRLENAKKDYTLSKEKFEKVKSDILNMHRKIIVGKIYEMSKSLQFYKDGKFDAVSAIKKIRTFVEQPPINSILEGNCIEISEWEKMIYAEATEQLIENSHLLVGYENGERELRKRELIDKLTPKIEATPTQMSTSHPSIKNDDPIFASKNGNLTHDLFEKFLDKKMDITSYIDTIAKIAKTTGLESKDFEFYLDKYNIEFFGDTQGFKDINKRILSLIPKFQKLSKLQNERKLNTISSVYRAIGDDVFVEKRDNEMFLIKMDENGEFSHDEKIGLYGGTVFLKDGRRVDVNFKKGITDMQVSVNGNNVPVGKIISLQDIKELEIQKTFSRDIRENIESTKYTTISDDEPNPWVVNGIAYSADVDKRSRILDFKSFVSDLKETIHCIPSDRQEQFIEEMTGLILSKTYVPRNSSEKAEYFYSSIQKSILQLVKDDKNLEKTYDVIESNAKGLNNLRKEVVEENSKHALIYFRNNEAQKKYMYYTKLQNEKAKEEEKKYIEDSVKNFDYKKFYELEGDIPLDNLPYYVSGVYTTQPMDSRSVLFHYDEFAKTARDLIATFPNNVQEEMFQKLCTNQIKRAYYIGPKDEKTEEVDEAFKKVEKILHDKIFLDKDIDKQEMDESLKPLNQHRVDKIEEGKEVSALYFKSEQSKNIYFTIRQLIDFSKKNGITESEIKDAVRGIVEFKKSENEITQDDSKPDRDDN